MLNRLKNARYKGKISAATTIIYPLLFGALFLIIWQAGLLHKLTNVSLQTLPLPSKIVSIISENFSKLTANLITTLIPTLIGLLAGSLLGYFLAIIATIFRKWGAGGLTVVACLNAVPIVALAPVINNWVRGVSTDLIFRGMLGKTLVVTLMCMASMSVNAFRGLTELRPFAKDLMKTYASPKLTLFYKLRLPNSLPYVFTALKVSVPMSVISALVSEYFVDTRVGGGSAPGLGRMIRDNILNAQYSAAWSYIAFACFFGIALYVVLIVCEGIMLRNRKA